MGCNCDVIVFRAWPDFGKILSEWHFVPRRWNFRQISETRNPKELKFYVKREFDEKMDLTWMLWVQWSGYNNFISILFFFREKIFLPSSSASHLKWIGVYFVASNNTPKIHICGQENCFILVKISQKCRKYGKSSFTSLFNLYSKFSICLLEI